MSLNWQTYQYKPAQQNSHSSYGKNNTTQPELKSHSLSRKFHLRILKLKIYISIISNIKLESQKRKKNHIWTTDPNIFKFEMQELLIEFPKLNSIDADIHNIKQTMDLKKNIFLYWSHRNHLSQQPTFSF